MAQLVKLRDFISRYETDIFRYPGQYIRLKKERWEKLNAIYDVQEMDLGKRILEEESDDHTSFQGFENFNDGWLESENRNVFSTIKQWFKKPKENVKVIDLGVPANEANRFVDREKTKEEMKQQFLDEIFHFQINWASSTIRDSSNVDKAIYKDEILKYFLQHFPDNYLLLYKPTLLVKKAPIDLEIILISPVTTYCISLLESNEMSVFETDRGRYWREVMRGHEIKRINPMLSLNRAESLIKGYYKHYNVEMPVNKIVLSRTGFIEGEYEPANTLLVDKRNYEEWYSRLRRLPSPIKFVQLKGAQALLKHSQSTYMPRYEWEQYEDESNSSDDFNFNDELS